MDSFNPTTKTQAALTSALQAASAAGNPEIRPAHLLMALLTQNDGIAAPLLEAVGVEPAAIRAEAQHLLDRLPQASGANAQPQLSRESLAAITTAQQLATEMDDEYVSTEHLMVGLATGDSDVAKLLTGHGASPQALREAFVKVRGSPRVTSADPESTYQALEKYGTRPDRTRPGRQARPGHRPRRRDSARHAGAVPPDQEQPGAHRRARRRQDRHRRGPGPADRRRRRAGEACATRRIVSLDMGVAGGRRQVPRRVRGTAQGRAQRDQRTRTARSYCSSTSCTPSSAPARPRARWMPAT